MSEGPIIGDWTQYEWIPDNASSFPARIRLRDTAWMVYYEPDVTGLKAEVLMLRKENERLHADQAHWELGNCPNCPNIADLQEALEQNAKLRELCKRVLKNCYDAYEQVWGWDDDWVILCDEARELGVDA